MPAVAWLVSDTLVDHKTCVLETITNFWGLGNYLVYDRDMVGSIT
jgi:hypothetical protein